MYAATNATMPPVAPDASDDVGGTFLTGLDHDGSRPSSASAPPKSSDRLAATTGREGLGSTLPYIHRLNSTGGGGRMPDKTASPYNVPNKHMRVYFPK